MSTKGRVVIVGGGILGTMHAIEAVRCGYEVTHLEENPVPSGASVRNFGLIWVGGRAPGSELRLALRARERWEQIASDNESLSFRPNGSLTIARTSQEWAVMQEAMAAADVDERGFALLDQVECRQKNPALSGPLIGGLFCARDAIVEPRLALSALRAQLLGSDAYTWLSSRRVVAIKPRGVIDATGEQHDGDLVICCTGASSSGLYDDELAQAPLRRVHLQMLETEPFLKPLTTALADGDSLRYYPAYANAALAALEPQGSVAAEWAAQLLLVQRCDGTLTIGDTHRYEEPFSFDLAEAPYVHLLQVAGELLGPLPAIARRWSGVYCQVTEENSLYYRREIDDGVILVTGPGGRGMTMSPAIAEETFQ